MPNSFIQDYVDCELDLQIAHTAYTLIMFIKDFWTLQII